VTTLRFLEVLEASGRRVGNRRAALSSSLGKSQFVLLGAPHFFLCTLQSGNRLV